MTIRVAIAAGGPLARVLDYSDDALVSSDIVGTTTSCTFDSGSSELLGAATS